VDEDDSWDGETEYLIDSDSDDDTVAYFDEFGGVDYPSDAETVTEDWDDPFLTPDKPIARLIIPDNLEEGLDFLNEI
jgi:hypothetical protein